MAQKQSQEVISISKPRFGVLPIRIVGTAPLVQARFSAKAMQAMKAKMLLGSAAKKGTKKESRDFDEDFLQAQHISEEGWNGIPASAFRNAAIDVCRMVGYRMTYARMSIFVEKDGLDRIDKIPLVMLDAGKPDKLEMATRNATGVADIRVRPIWKDWAVNLRVKFDEDQFRVEDVVNLLDRAGAQVGIGEGRPFSKNSNGLGYGTFEVEM